MKLIKHFTAAPHRVMFFGGAVQSVAAMLWWLFELSTRYLFPGHIVAWPLFPAAIHAWLLLYSMLPFFIFGFLMTTFPRWMNGTEIPVQRYLPAFLLMLLGAGLFYAGLFLGRTLIVMASVSALAGWATALYALLRVLLDTRHPDKRHPAVLFSALCLGWIGLGSFLLWLLTDEHRYLQFFLRAGLWWFVLPVFASVAHRMIPFFTGSALSRQDVPRPYWPWATILVASAAHGLLELFNVPAWLWLCDIPLAACALYLSYLWGLRSSLRVPLLAVLHVGFAWMGVAVLLFAAQSLWLWAHGGTGFIWGLAPLHALTIGCFATLMIGMGTRVTLGHSGLPFIIDTPVKLMFIGIQLVAVLRVLADMLPLDPAGFYLAAVLLWLLCFLPWVWRYLPAYWRPRADGQPG